MTFHFLQHFLIFPWVILLAKGTLAITFWSEQFGVVRRKIWKLATKCSHPYMTGHFIDRTRIASICTKINSYAEGSNFLFIVKNVFVMCCSPLSLLFKPPIMEACCIVTFDLCMETSFWMNCVIIECCFYPGGVKLWDVDRSCCVRVMEGHAARVGSLAWNAYTLSRLV